MVNEIERPPEILFGVENICKALGMGKTRLKKWRARGLPVKMIDGVLTGHRESLENFIRDYLQKE
jgi:hypothetical protein